MIVLAHITYAEVLTVVAVFLAGFLGGVLFARRASPARERR